MKNQVLNDLEQNKKDFLQSPDLQTLKMADQAEPFSPTILTYSYTLILMVKNAEFLQITTHLLCFAKEVHLEINYKNERVRIYVSIVEKRVLPGQPS